MKGLRPDPCFYDTAIWRIHFYLVTWMKGLRPPCEPVIADIPRPIFTLWPEWRDYDGRIDIHSFWTSADFYLVTWMKGLRRSVAVQCHSTFIAFLPCDLNEGITTIIRAYFPSYSLLFLPCDLNEGITTVISRTRTRLTAGRIFTLWPEWRDYDWRAGAKRRTETEWFLPCDLNEGITTR